MNIDKERRNSPRIQLHRQAKLDFNTKVYEEGLIQNFSLIGMFVQGDFQGKEGDHCVINIAQKGKYSWLSLDASAQIVRKDDKGVAIAFTSMPLESLMHLQMILHCEVGADSLSSGIESLDNLPFEVHDDLLR